MDTDKIYDNFTLGSAIYKKTDKVCIKYHNKHDRGKEWLKMYKELQKFEPRLVKIYKVHEADKSLEMEYLENIQTFDTIVTSQRGNKELLKFCISEFLDIYKNFYNFSIRYNNGLVTHHDYTLKNIALVNNNTVKLLDPDSIAFSETGQYHGSKAGKFIESFMILYTSIEFL